MSGVLVVLLTVLGITAWRMTHRKPPPRVRQTVFEGIVYVRDVRRTPRPLVAHLLILDLKAPGLRFLVTPGDPAKRLPLRARATSGFLQEFGAQAAINGDFFHPWRSRALWDYYPHVGDPVTVDGFAASEGIAYVRNPKRPGQRTTLHLSRENRARIGPLPRGEKPFNALSGDRFLLRNGEIPKTLGSGGGHQPRTAFGLDRAARHLFLIVVDGRQAGFSEGVTLPELAAILREHGAYTAVNADGGGSTTLVMQAENGRGFRVLNSPIDNRIPGRERPIANHLGIFARPVPGTGSPP